MSAGLEMDFTNMCMSQTFRQDEYYYFTQEFLAGINIRPGPNLEPGTTEKFQYTSDFSSLAAGDASAYCCWNDGKRRFGIKIVAPKQVLGMGDRPYWMVMNDSHLNSSEIDWTASGDHPSDEYTFDDSVGYSIVAKPNSEHQSLTVQVTIQPL